MVKCTAQILSILILSSISILTLASGDDAYSKPATIILVSEDSENNADTLRFEIVSSILSTAYSRLNIDVEYQLMPAARALLSSSTGKADGEMYRLKSAIADSYPQLLVVDVPIIKIETVALYVFPNINIQSWSDLIPYRVVNRIGYKQSEAAFQKYAINYESVNSTQSMVRMVAFSRADIAVGIYADLKREVDRVHSEMQGINFYFSQPVSTIELNHFLHEKNKDLVPLIEEQLSIMLANNEIEEITQAILRNHN